MSLARDALRPAPQRAQPGWTAPMLAVLTQERFSDAAWVFERKLDGVRCLAFRHDAELHLRSRTRQALNGTYPELADALLAQGRADKPPREVVLEADA